MIKYKQQGDVIIQTVTTIPAEATPIEGATLALGEFSGHHHTLFDTAEADAPKSFNPTQLGALTSVKLFEIAKTGDKFAKIEETVFLKHQEHKTIRIEPGLYKIGIVKEVDPFSDEVRDVRD
jgi:hypothetical protein